MQTLTITAFTSTAPVLNYKPELDIVNEQLQAGRRAFLAQCGKCHSLKSESSVPKEAWEETVSRMRSKNGAKLTDEDVANISRYLYAIASR